jgi:preprotein translocase subunit YajC
MLISQALAQETAPPMTTAETAVPMDAAAATPPSTQSILIQNVGMIVLLVVMFYFLLIRPQQKRFKEHKEMVDSLKTGDKVIIGGGIMGKVDTLVNSDEVLVDLGNGVKVTAVRSMIQIKTEKPVDTKKK